MHRRRNGEEYYVLPGGGVEINESIEAAAVREAKEETCLDIKLGKKLLEVRGSDSSNIVFLVESFKGEPRLSSSAPEVERQAENNAYRLVWIDFNLLNNLDVVPTSVADKLKSYLETLI
jgi:8-oxo-dGTP pyrophosphatase MutT (NUDIX family)